MRKTTLGILILLFMVGGYFLFKIYGREFLTPTLPESVSVPADKVCQDCNLVLISMTNLRYDHMSMNGYFRKTTPNLDKLAKNSIVFKNAFGHSSWTLPEGISIYTSLYPFEHGVMNRYDGSTLAKSTPTIIESLKQAGYKTAAFTGGFDYNPEFGLTNRFDHYEECTQGQGIFYPRQPGPRIGGPSKYGELNCTVPKAVDWLRANKDKKFFIHVQGFDAHCPFSQNGGKLYDPDYKGKIDFSDCLWTFDKTEPRFIDGKKYYPVYFSKTGTDKFVLLDEQDVKHLLAIYDEGINEADSEIALLLDQIKEMGIEDKTVIVFTSEHGDMFGKYGRFMRGGPLRGTFYDDVLHIPLIIKDPKLMPRNVDGLAAQIDLMPTVLDLLGLKTPSHISGESLTSLITDNTKVNDYVFAGSTFKPGATNLYYSKKTRVEAVRSLDWKLIKETVLNDNPPTESVELYNVKNDSQEMKNLAGSEKDILRDLESKLDKWSGEIRAKECQIKVGDICLFKRLFN